VKALLWIVGGFAVSLGMFVIGLAAVTLVLTVQPGRQPRLSQNVAELWTAVPRKVDKAAQGFERLPPLPAPTDPNVTVDTAAGATADLDQGAIDTVTTSAVQGSHDDGGQQRQAGELLAAHAAWCASRYRSWRPESNTYTRYDGRRWPCVSPYTKHLPAERLASALAETGSHDAEAIDEPSALRWQYASSEVVEDSYPPPDHVSYCLSRYRSYRPEDNTYQPYGGGPRRKCR
jgi:hypothetical protein